ncbi:hypothetical protein [Blastochloris viridis]|uniref:Lysine biosynthesis protein LysW n=1 Tax=Blastochloris viridis TaxID=1079 RepID=A0A0H5BEG2_BLAVI|nr:hypothetical protein [Blastochloris viridis]ALK09512.1 hypothetical protein BVIR_1737 [Blastochloris viridis]BAS00603.1 hypothetical protein BV133_3009 [Blastochloris viridis]CUU42175.1 hypothetical protein BVIRIDIS_11820 [Blastochloris viridis]
MSDGKITATCTKCNVELSVANIDDDNSLVVCPQCGTEFGKWGEVKTKLKAMLADKFKDTPWIKGR